MVRRERGRNVAVVAIPQIVEQPGAIAHVDVGIAEIGLDEVVATRRPSDELARLRQDLHQADRAGARPHVRIKATLCIDDGGDESGVEIALAGVRANDVLVLERVTRTQVPVRFGVHDPCGRTREREQRKGDRDENTHRGEAVRPGPG